MADEPYNISINSKVQLAEISINSKVQLAELKELLNELEINQRRLEREILFKSSRNVDLNGDLKKKL